ncbi:MAG: hypothetical protein Q7V05_16330 [Methanoregula sp.]|nr:hypothetical protein [Methanoregula sp.]
MGLARLIKFVGLVALVAGIIGFLLPGEFMYSPMINSLLTQYGNALIPGIGKNPSVKMLIEKAPAIILAVIGFGMLFWGTMKDLTEPQEHRRQTPRIARNR